MQPLLEPKEAVCPQQRRFLCTEPSSPARSGVVHDSVVELVRFRRLGKDTGSLLGTLAFEPHF